MRHRKQTHMASFFTTLFDEIIAALGGGYDKPQPPQTYRPPPPPAEDITGQQNSTQDVPVKDALCVVCGFRPAKPEYSYEYCDADCIRRAYDRDLADRMDAWHDQFQERFGDD